MKTNKDFIYRSIAGEGVLVPTGQAAQRFNGMINLTDTAAFIWKQINTAKNPEEIAEKLQEEYEVDAATARKDTYGFLAAMYRQGLVSDIPEFEENSSGE